MNSALHKLLFQREHLFQFIKFSLVGVSNTLLSLAIYYILILFEVNYILANTIAFIISVLNSYIWNNRFVFRKRVSGHLKPLLKTYIAYGSTFILTTGLMYIMIEKLGITQLIAPLINLVITFPLNFLINKFWAFK